MLGVPIFKLCKPEQVAAIADIDRAVTHSRFDEFASNHADELPSGDCSFEVYDIIIQYLSFELDVDFHDLINSMGLGHLRNPNEGLWDFIIFDKEMANKIIPLLRNSAQFTLRGKVIGLPEYFAVDYEMHEKKGEFTKAIDILLSHMERVDNGHVLVFLLY